MTLSQVAVKAVTVWLPSVKTITLSAISRAFKHPLTRWRNNEYCAHVNKRWFKDNLVLVQLFTLRTILRLRISLQSRNILWLNSQVCPRNVSVLDCVYTGHSSITRTVFLVLQTFNYKSSSRSVTVNTSCTCTVIVIVIDNPHRGYNIWQERRFACC